MAGKAGIVISINATSHVCHETYIVYRNREITYIETVMRHHATPLPYVEGSKYPTTS